MFGFNHISPTNLQFKVDEIVELLKSQTFDWTDANQTLGAKKQARHGGRALLYSPQLLLLDEPLSV